MLARLQFDPVASNDFGVRHEADFKIDVGLEGGVCMVRVREVLNSDLAALEQSLGGRNQSWVGDDDFDERGLLLCLDRIMVVIKIDTFLTRSCSFPRSLSFPQIPFKNLKVNQTKYQKHLVSVDRGFLFQSDIQYSYDEPIIV